MQLSDSGLELLKSFEGCVLHVYKDQVGRDTIGYGHLLTPNEIFQNGITQAQAENLLKRDAQRFEFAVSRLIKVPLTQNQFDALVCMTFNTGTAPLTQTLGKKLNAGRYHDVPAEMMRWCKGVVGGKLVALPVLVKRRAAEAHLWVTCYTNSVG